MPLPMLIRATTAGDKTTVRVLMRHDMESGQRLDTLGRPVPAWHIQTVSARLNGQPVFTAQWGPSIAKDPFLQFVLRGARPGDVVAIGWVDNRGEHRDDEALVA